MNNIYSLIDTCDLEELNSIKEYIDLKIETYNYKNSDVLFTKLSNYIDSKFGIIEKNAGKFDSILLCINDIIGVDIDDILVFDLINIDKDEFQINQFYPGEMTMKMIDDELQKDGLGINYKISADIIESVEHSRYKNIKIKKIEK